MKFRGIVLFLALCALPAFGQETPANTQQESSPASPAQQTPNGEASTPGPTPTPDLTPDAQGKLSQQQMQELFRVVAEKDRENDKLLRNYTYIERDVEHKLDGKGATKSTEIKTYEVLEVYGEQVRRLTEKNDQALDSKDATKEEEKVQKVIDKRKNESDEDRKKREEKEEKEREEDRKFLTEVADAYNFKLVGTEAFDGRDAWVIDGEPRPGFVATTKEGKYLPKFHGRVWIDKSDLQLAKMDVECLDTVSVGVFLARFHKGSRFMLEQTRVNDEVWLPRVVNYKVDVRLALVKNIDADVEQTFRDYKKFRTSAKIVGVGEVKEEQK
jgi:hypothetical protein